MQGAVADESMGLQNSKGRFARCSWWVSSDFCLVTPGRTAWLLIRKYHNHKIKWLRVLYNLHIDILEAPGELAHQLVVSTLCSYSEQRCLHPVRLVQSGTAQAGPWEATPLPYHSPSPRPPHLRQPRCGGQEMQGGPCYWHLVRLPAPAVRLPAQTWC